MMDLIELGPTGTLYGASKGIIWDVSDVRANLKTLAEKYPDEMGRVLREEALAIMEHSLMLCPFDQNNPHLDGTPHLNETGDVAGPYNDEGIISVELSYNTPYAVLQHEIQEYHHDAPETWKYLEHPMNERAKYMATNIVRGVDMERLGVGYESESIFKLKQDRQKWVNLRKAQAKYQSQLGRFMGPEASYEYSE